MLTQQEQELLTFTGDVWNKFMQLPKLHDSDQPEMCSKIHYIQNMILSRPAYRDLYGISPENITAKENKIIFNFI